MHDFTSSPNGDIVFCRKCGIILYEFGKGNFSIDASNIPDCKYSQTTTYSDDIHIRRLSEDSYGTISN